MSASPQTADLREVRVLVLAPFGRDARLADRTLRQAGLVTWICADLGEMRREIAAGAGAVLVADEALVREDSADPGSSWVGPEPPWSQLPLVVLTRAGPYPVRVGPLRRLEQRPNVTFLRRPVPRLTLVSTLRAALESRRRQYAVRDLVEELEAGVRQRDEFLATLGHELRNPLGAILNAVELLRDEEVGAREARQFARSLIERQVQHLRRILDDLLEVSRITRGKLQLSRLPLELGRVCRSAAEAVRPAIEERRHELTLHLPEGEVWVDGDETRIEQILWNLLGNAAKYTDPGGHLSLSLTRSGPTAELRVRDDGRGMTPAFLEQAFELFAQAEVGKGGLGLGLPLSRRLAELQGGSLSAASEGLGKGSEFVLRLAAGEPAAASQPAEGGPSPSARHRTLVVEDHADLAWALHQLLAHLGQEVRTVGTGRDAIAIAADYRPELVLVDIGLPDLDGGVVAARLREQLGPRVLLATMTGFGEAVARRRALAAGCDRHLTKPVSSEALKDLLAMLEGQRP